MPQAPSLARAARRCCFCSVLFCHFKRLFELWLNTDWKIRASKMYPGIRLFFACNVHSCITILSASGANMEGSKASILAEDSSTPRLSLAFDQILFVRYPESITEKLHSCQSQECRGLISSCMTFFLNVLYLRRKHQVSTVEVLRVMCTL